jgi:hypothetical protein
MHCISWSFLGLVSVLAPLVSRVANAQARTLDSATVSLVATTTLPPGTRAMVVRRARLTPQNVIMLDRSAAAPEDLDASLRLLGALRLQFGDQPPVDIKAAPKSATLPTNWASGRQSKMRGYLQSLVASPTKDIPGIGRVRALDIKVGPPHGRFLPSVH